MTVLDDETAGPLADFVPGIPGPVATSGQMPITDLSDVIDVTPSRVVTEPQPRPVPAARVNEIPVDVQVVIGRTRLSVAQLMAAEQGQCFQLDARFGDPVELQVNGKTIGYAELVADDFDNLIGVRLVSIAPFS